MSQRSERLSGKRRERGIFQRHRKGCTRPVDGSCGCSWSVCYFDETGQKHRENVGPKGLALKVYQKRKNEVHERRFFPERIRRREVLVADMIDQYLGRVKGKLRSYRDCARYGEVWKTALSGKTLRQVVPGDIERWMTKRMGEVRPATVN